MLQIFLVSVIVVAAAVYAVWMFTPALWRRRLAARIESSGRRWGLSDTASRGLAQRVAAQGGCSDCSSCQQCGPADAKAAAGAKPTA